MLNQYTSVGKSVAAILVRVALCVLIPITILAAALLIAALFVLPGASVKGWILAIIFIIFIALPSMPDYD